MKSYLAKKLLGFDFFFFLNSQPIWITKDAKIQRLTTNNTCYGENIKAWWDGHMLLLKRLGILDTLNPLSKNQEWR